MAHSQHKKRTAHECVGSVCIVSAWRYGCLNLKGTEHFSLFKHERWPSRTTGKDELHIND